MEGNRLKIYADKLNEIKQRFLEIINITLNIFLLKIKSIKIKYIYFLFYIYFIFNFNFLKK